MSGRLVFVEDSLARAAEIRRLLDLYRSGDARRDGRPLPPLAIAAEEYWDPVTALDRIGGGSSPEDPPGSAAVRWDADDQLFMDCWDRDAMDDSISTARTTFFALDLLRSLRSAAEAGQVVPRIIVHSRGMSDDLLRAALGEFVRTRRRVRVPGASPVVRWRLDEDGDSTGAVIWAMFDRLSLERNLDRILAGDRSARMEPPAADSPVWAQMEPTSCLASFHCAVRDECPEVWGRFVVGRGAGAFGDLRVDDASIARITRAAKRYLAVRDSWGRRGYKGYLAIARALANPGA